MSSSPTQPPTPENPRARVQRARLHTGHPRLHEALVWIALLAIAAFPFPWWW